MRLAEEEASRLAALLNEQFGWDLGPDARTVLEKKLERRVAELSLPTFADYVRLLTYDRRRAEELTHLADVLTTRETYFFREAYQLRALSEEIFPRLARENAATKTLRIWSAGCASGEEVYTIAMLALDCKELEGFTIDVFGSDVSPAALAQARRGEYESGALREMPAVARARWMTPVDGTQRWGVSDRVRARVRFGAQNLLADPLPQSAPFDVVLCRNVTIYFSAEARKQVARSFLDALRPGGWLLMGHAESLVSVTSDFELVTLKNDVVYRKPAAIARLLKVLVVDDSAFARKTLVRVLSTLPGVDLVGTASDGVAALRELRRTEPDVVLLDLEMPELDGWGVLRALRGASRPPVVIVISGESGAPNVVKALELGAFDFIAKPSREATPDLERVANDLVPRLLALKEGARPPRAPVFPADSTPLTPPRAKTDAKPAEKVVVICASTGGPGAILEVVSALPADLDAAVVVAVHMPPGFTAAFAERLTRRARMPAEEAQSGQLLLEGKILVCPGGHHVTLARSARGWVTAVLPAQGEVWVPSADRLLASAAPLGAAALGVVLTGMGTDGASGAGALRAAGGRVVAESAETAVVNGMPAAVVAAGAADAVRRRDEIAAAIRAWSAR